MSDIPISIPKKLDKFWIVYLHIETKNQQPSQAERLLHSIIQMVVRSIILKQIVSDIRKGRLCPAISARAKNKGL